MSAPATRDLLYEGADWDFDRLRRVYAAVEEIAVGEMGLDIYPNQIEVITAEQMLDAYSSSGMPLMYKHWSFGKHFARDELLYRRGLRGLAYEIVINANPCISYIMEENSITMQTLVIAHAAFGHNHFFKNNYLFQQWTDAEGIRDYLEFAKGYIGQCEERYGEAAVESLLDAAHALMNHGIHSYPRRRKPNLMEEQRREAERRAYQEATYNDLWQRTVPRSAPGQRARREEQDHRLRMALPEENILYFLEKHAPKLKPWQREVLRIVRNIAQYFYPQRQTKVMNEGCATYCHYTIMNRLYELGRIPDGAMLEFLAAHTSVIFQPEYDDARYSGLNPYALGFAIMQDIQRICEQPTAEDREWFPDFAGSNEAMAVLKDAWANYRDESFVLQFLSPHVIRKLKLFKVGDEADAPEYLVEAIHNERGYREIRRALARHYEVSRQQPDIQVVDANLIGNRKLILQHTVADGILLEEAEAKLVLKHLAHLWGYEADMLEVDAASGAVLKEHKAKAV